MVREFVENGARSRFSRSTILRERKRCDLNRGPALSLGAQNGVMNRRQLMALLGSGVLVHSMTCEGAHVISINPLVVESDLTSVTSRYTPLEDFYVRDIWAYQRRGDGFPGIERGRKTADSYFEQLTASQDPAGVSWSVPEIRCSPTDSSATAYGRVGPSAASFRWLNQLLGMYVHLFGRDGYSRSVPSSGRIAMAFWRRT